MKWFFRSVFWLFLIVFFGIWTYISLVFPQENSLIVKSRLQGTHILHPKQWALFPERIVPNYVHIEEIPKSLKLTGSVETNLPYYELLENLGHFFIQASYTLEHPLNKKDIDNFAQIGSEGLKQYWKAQIEGILLSEIQNYIQNDKFIGVDFLKTAIKKRFTSLQEIDIQFTNYPNMEEYKKFKSQVLIALNKGQLATKAATFNFEVLQEQKKLELRKDKMAQMLEFSIQQSKNLSDAQVDPQTTFSILGYLLNSPLNYESHTDIIKDENTRTKKESP